MNALQLGPVCGGCSGPVAVDGARCAKCLEAARWQREQDAKPRCRVCGEGRRVPGLDQRCKPCFDAHEERRAKRAARTKKSKPRQRRSTPRVVAAPTKNPEPLPRLPGGSPILSLEECTALAPLARAGDRLAVARFLASCEGLVHQTAYRYARRSLMHMMDDLVAELRESCLQSIATYDPSRGMNFAGFALFAMRKRCIKFARRQRYAVTLPYVGRKVDELRYGGNVTTEPMYLTVDGEEYERPFPANPGPERDVLLRERLSRAVARLPERERFVVEQCFARDAREEDAAAALGCSRQRVQQLKERAYDRIARELASHGISSRDA